MSECELCALRKRVAELEAEKTKPALKVGDLAVYTEGRVCDSPLAGTVGVVMSVKEGTGYNYQIAVADSVQKESHGYYHRDGDFPGKLLRWTHAREVEAANK